MLQATVFFSGSHVKKYSSKLLFIMIFNPVLLKTKITKHGSHKLVQILIPDFFVQTFMMLIPFQVQVVRQPLRDDLLLSKEQQNYVNQIIAMPERQQNSELLLQHVANQFSTCEPDQYHKLMVTYEVI